MVTIIYNEFPALYNNSNSWKHYGITISAICVQMNHWENIGHRMPEWFELRNKKLTRTGMQMNYKLNRW